MTAHGALWKWRAAENEGKPKPGFPSLFPGPWKSPGDSPILHSADRGCLCLKTPTKTKERSPRFALARFSLLQAHSSIRKCFVSGAQMVYRCSRACSRYLPGLRERKPDWSRRTAVALCSAALRRECQRKCRSCLRCWNGAGTGSDFHPEEIRDSRVKFPGSPYRAW